MPFIKTESVPDCQIITSFGLAGTSRVISYNEVQTIGTTTGIAMLTFFNVVENVVKDYGIEIISGEIVDEK